METHREFELIVKDYLQRHPGIDHEWRRISDRLSGSHTDLVCAPESEQEVFARLRKNTIQIGDRDGHVEFEDLAQTLSRQKLATKALAHLIQLLQRKSDAANIEI